MFKRCLYIIIATCLGLSELSAMLSPVLSRESSFEFEKESQEARKVREQTPALFRSIEDYARALSYAEPYKGQPSVDKGEIATVSKEQLPIFKNAAEKYLSWSEYGSYPGKEHLKTELEVLKAQLPKDSELGKLIDANAEKQVFKYLVDLNKKKAEDDFKSQLIKDESHIPVMRGPYGETIFHLLARVDSTGEIYQEIKKVVSLIPFLDIKDEKGNNLLHAMSLFGNKVLLMVLTEELKREFPHKLYEMSLEKNSAGQTPREVAAESVHPEMEAALTMLPLSPRK